LLAELVDDADIVVHLAAAVGVKLIVESPVKTIETKRKRHATHPRSRLQKKETRSHRFHFRSLRQNTNVPFHEDADLVLGPTTKGRWSYARL